MRLTRYCFAIFGVMLLADAAMAISVVIRPDAQMVRLAPAVVVGSVLGTHTQLNDQGGIETVTTFSVEEVIKGFVGGSTIDVHEPGGVYGDRAWSLPGIPRFEDGERNLLFLSKSNDGQWHVMDTVLGKFRFETDRLGRSVLLRDLRDTAVLNAPGGQVESARDAAGFLTFLRSAAIGGPVKQQNYLVPAEPLISSSFSSPRLTPQTNAAFSAESYTSDVGDGTGSRWTSFPVGWRSIGTEPGAPANAGQVAGSTAITTGMNAWNTAPGASINYVYNGNDASNTTESPCGGNGVGDGKNTLAFEYNLGCMGVTAFTCTTNSYSGVLGLGGVSGTTGPVDNTTPDGSRFHTTTDGDVWMNQGIANCTLLLTTNVGDWNSAVTHELGHSLGWRHSDKNRTDAAGCGTDAIAEECSSSAIMTASVTHGLNATLQSWDRNAASLVYPGTTVAFVRGDFNGDGHPDLVWHNYTSGAVNIWFMNGTTYLGGMSLFTVPDLNWHIEGVGDFNGDGKSDLVWRNYSTGAVNVWFMNGTTYLGGTSLFTVSDLNWHIEAVNDFNGDGHDDLVWRNYSTGAVNVWFMNGTTYLGGATLFTVADPNWHIVGAGDFNGDSKADLVWRNQSTGAVNVWFMNGTTYLGGTSLFTVADSNWQINAVGDYNNDGKPDLVWRNYSTGAVNVWFMNNTTYLGGTTLFTVADPSWKIEGPR